MSGKDHLDRPSECAQNSTTFSGDVLQLYREAQRTPGNNSPSPSHIDFSLASDPYNSKNAHGFNAQEQRDIYKDVRHHELNLHSFIKTEQKALADNRGRPVDAHHSHEAHNHDGHHHRSISQRLITQQSSIFKNVTDGDLTESEFVQLEKDQHRLEGLKTSLQMDGSLSSDDRKELNHAVDAQWGKIKSLISNSDNDSSTGGDTNTPPTKPVNGGDKNPPASGTDNPSPNPTPNPSDNSTPPAGSDNQTPNPTPDPGDTGSPPTVAQLINPNTKFAVSAAAKSALNDTPNPISEVQVEGKLPSVPIAQASRESLKDMPRLEALGEAYRASHDEKYADKAKEYLLAWAKVNHSTGNPINDAQLYNTINTYALIKDSDAIKNDPGSQKKIEGYLKSVADAELKSHNFNMTENWNAHRIELIANVGFALNDKSLISQSMALYKNFLGVNINADGSTLDFHKRDALHYHNYDLEPLLRLAEVAGRNGYPGMFDYTSPNGGSLRKAVDFEIPYVTGAKSHLEFKNSKIAFDKQRADAGVKGMSIAPFNPKKAKYVMELAADLDPSYKQYDKYVD